MSNNKNFVVKNGIESGGLINGRDVAADGTKLDSIESGAQVNETAAVSLTKLKTVDGDGSGLDADLLDGLDSTDFDRAGDAIVFAIALG